MVRQRLTTFFLLIALQLFSVSEAEAAAFLNGIDRRDEPTRIFLIFTFNKLPAYKMATSGRRIDLELVDTNLAVNFRPPEADSRMIKLTTKTEGGSLFVSLYFRYPPQLVNVNSTQNTQQLTLDILLGNRLSASTPEVSSKLHGIPIVKSTTQDSFNPLKATDFAKNWRSFFTAFESPVEIIASPLFHLPPSPLADALSLQSPPDEWLPKDMQHMFYKRQWHQLIPLLREQLRKQLDEKIKEQLVLTYAECLTRTGEFKESQTLLRKITVQYPDSLLARLAGLLLIYQQAARDDYVNAYYELLTFRKTPAPPLPFTGSLNLLEAEMAIMAGRFTEAEQLLSDPAIGDDPVLTEIRDLRRADLLAARGKKADALSAYLEINSRSTVLQADPMSLARFADALYSAKVYSEAATYYQKLSELMTNKPQSDLVLFRLAMAQLHVPATAKRASIEFQQIREAFQKTEGGTRATLKQADIEFISNRLKARDAEAMYGKVAATAMSVSLREESAFKQALVNGLSGEHEKSVHQCMQLLRSFQSGSLRTEAAALLIQQLPAVIQQLVQHEQYVKALVLAKQNRQLFMHGWLDTSVLYDLARAYAKLGLTDQASQTYQYLFEVSDEATKENVYLPLIKELFASGFFKQVQEYADRYRVRYPKGKDLAAVQEYKTRALYASGRYDEALTLIKDTETSRPQSRESELLKGRMYFDTNDWSKVIATLSQPEIRSSLPPDARLWLAESYFQTGEPSLAVPLFLQVREETPTADQALFRLAQIAALQEKPVEALKLFKELAEKGSDPLWSKLARQEAEILELLHINKPATKL